MQPAVFGDLTLASFCFPLMDARMYVLRSGKEAVVIDPFEEPAVLEALSGAETVRVFLTHEHFDHISGVNWLRQQVPCRVTAGARCASILQSKRNGTAQFPLLFLGDRETYHFVREHYHFPYHCEVDETVRGTAVLSLGRHRMEVYETPGHSPGSITVAVDGKLLFAGDNLLGNGYELKTTGADREAYRAALKFYQRLTGKQVTVYPGHGEPGPLEDFLNKIGRYIEWN